MSRFKQLVHEVHRRSLWQVLGIYLVTSWVVFQVVQSLTEGLQLPDWFPALAFVLLLIGLPIVLATAFIQEGVGSPPDQIPIANLGDTDVTMPVADVHRLFTWRNALSGGVLAFAGLGFLGVVWTLLGPGTLPTRAVAAGEEVNGRSIAVLPFVSARVDEENESFRIGVHDALLTQLAKVQDLRVTSRTSVLEYHESQKNIQLIGDELGVGTILEGTVQRAGDVVQINVQLIDVATDDHLWAETFTRELTTANLIAIQNEIVRDIARELRTVLSPQEERRMTQVPTQNLDAYDLFLSARAQQQRSNDVGRQSAASLLEQAVLADPNFALAHAWLSIAHSYLYWFGQDRSETRVERAKAAADRALELNPNLPEGHFALAHYYYRAHRDYGPALSELALAEQGMGERADVARMRAAILRRQGDFAGSVREFQRSARLDPRSAQGAFDLTQTLFRLGRFEEAIRAADRTIALSPNSDRGYNNKAEAYVLWTGDLAAARRVMDEAIAAGLQPRYLYTLALLDRNPAEALKLAQAIPTEIVPQQYGPVPKAMLVGEAYHRLGRVAEARESAESALEILERLLAERPMEATTHQYLAWAHSRLGHADQAVQAAQRAIEIMPVSRDAFIGQRFVRTLAETYVDIGLLEPALDALESLTENGLGVGLMLEVDPVWDPLRDHPRFRALLEE